MLVVEIDIHQVEKISFSQSPLFIAEGENLSVHFSQPLLIVGEQGIVASAVVVPVAYRRNAPIIENRGAAVVSAEPSASVPGSPSSWPK